MVGIRVISLVSHIFNHTIFLLVNPRKAVTERFRRCSVESKSQTRLEFPRLSLVMHVLHDLPRKFPSDRICVADTLHQIRHLINANIAK